MKLFCIGTMLIAASLTAHAASLITNGDFAGGLTGWTLQNAGVGLGGEAQVVNSLGSLTPSTAGQFALLDTGPAATLASATPTFASLSQSFTVTAADTYNIGFLLTPLTARFTGAFADELDRFSVTLTPGVGPSATLFSTDLSNPGFVLISGAPVTSPSGSNFFEMLPTLAYSNAMALAAGTYTLEFQVETDQNSLFDSGLLIEGVSVASSSTAVVPEPSTLLLAPALAGLFLARRKFAARHQQN